ncbi:MULTISPECIES: hypothetical protein [Hymenobacter]|uniref:Uncharacterized protein n=1 Tax=Hymenobacter mucosus TaxID=1411120 RepID=A0A239BBG5_9BACT|nr:MULTISPECIES: hypothetical protein [Hymenobacter]MDF7815577.1 hypothetical protein [Hymenobacter sp. YC55]SNS04514.1 hypothetical protein SAMN06269173_12015 [Hymenobacter mucosus]
MEVYFASPGPGSHATSVTVTGASSVDEAVNAAQNRIYAEYGTDRYEVVITPPSGAPAEADRYEMSVSITDSQNGNEAS